MSLQGHRARRPIRDGKQRTAITKVKGNAFKRRAASGLATTATPSNLRITPDTQPSPHPLKEPSPAYEAHWPPEKRARAAEGFRRLAESDRACVIECERLGNEIGAGANASEAMYHEMMAQGLERLPGTTVCGIGGEVAVVREQSDCSDNKFKNTLEKPETTSSTASYARMCQAEALGADVLTQALDAAETIQARDSIERMAAHQLAALHAAALKTTARGLELLDRAEKNGSNAQHFQMLNVEGARLLGTAARLMSAFQTGHATIVKLRQGGRQEVKVVHQYVQVTDGGQAVVAGEFSAPGALPGTGCKK